MKTYAVKGDIIYSKSPDELAMCEDGYAVCENGTCAGVFKALPERFAGLPVMDFTGKLVVPGFCDLHLHAAQYANIGLGMDYELLEWLDKLTFPEEARFAEPEYAKLIYDRFIAELRAGGTTRTCVFATVHVPATTMLMEKLEKSGLRAYVGKVNMDRNSPDGLRESGADSISATRRWIEDTRGRFKNVRPIITPRFVPSCSSETMSALGKLAEEYSLSIQSHLSENRSEIEWVKKLHPDCRDYASVYDKFGLLGEKTVMAHCVHLTDNEARLLKDTGTFIAHCPASNTNVRSGMAPARGYMDMGISMGLGSDISGGDSLDMLRVMREAIAVSKHVWQESAGETPFLKTREAFWLATRGGGAFFENVGAFENGYEFDAVVYDDARLGGMRELDLRQRFERLIFMCSNADVCAKIVGGERLF